MIIVAALIALVQIYAQRNGMPSPVATVGTSVASILESTTEFVVVGTRNGVGTLIALPHLAGDNQALVTRNEQLAAQNAQLQETVEAYKQTAALQPVIASNQRTVQARVIGFPPENESQSVTIDRGSIAGVHKDDGVVAGGGAVVGIVQEADPFTSKVVLITDYASRIPAVVRNGRYWGIVRGNLASVHMEYISQDAPLRVGETVITGEGRSFHSGSVIGTIAKIERSPESLYQTAVLKPAVDIGALDRVVVIQK